MTFSHIRLLGIAGILLLSLSHGAFPASRRNRFPQIRRATISVATNPSSLETNQTLIIRDIHGEPAYELSIIAVTLNHRTTHSIHISLSTTGRYSPDPEEKYEPNLLNPDYWGHGDGESFHPEQLCPANRNNPLYGARREYYLRRMHIVAEVSDIELNAEGIVRMRMTITVEPNESRRSRPRDIPWGDMKLCQ
jgi:hypothetical protein